MKGEKGAPGLTGMPGKHGINGIPGLEGAIGPRGLTGAKVSYPSNLLSYPDRCLHGFAEIGLLTW